MVLNPTSAEAEMFWELGQYYGCWWPGDTSHQAINSHAIVYVK